MSQRRIRSGNGRTADLPVLFLCQLLNLLTFLDKPNYTPVLGANDDAKRPFFPLGLGYSFIDSVARIF